MCFINVIWENQNANSAAAAISLDAKRVFNRVEWPFLIGTFVAFGFGEGSVSWVRLLYLRQQSWQMAWQQLIWTPPPFTVIDLCKLLARIFWSPVPTGEMIQELMLYPATVDATNSLGVGDIKGTTQWKSHDWLLSLIWGLTRLGNGTQLEIMVPQLQIITTCSLAHEGCHDSARGPWPKIEKHGLNNFLLNNNS